MDTDPKNPGGTESLTAKSKDSVYQEYIDRFRDQYKPASVTETFLVEQMAHAQWKMDRVAQMEANLMLHQPPPAKEFARLKKYVNSARRSFQQALKTLMLLRKTRAGRPAQPPGTVKTELFSKLEPVDFAPTA